MPVCRDCDEGYPLGQYCNSECRLIYSPYRPGLMVLRIQRERHELRKYFDKAARPQD